MALAGLLACGYLFLAQGRTAEATGIQDKIDNQKDKVDGAQQRLDAISGKIDSLTDEQDLVEEKISDIKAEILNTMADIGLLEDEISEKKQEISDKEADIAKTQEEYEAAKATADQQQQDMMEHVRIMYESGNVSYISLLLAGEGISDALNRLDYIEKLYDFDSCMLERYKETQNQVQALWDQLEAEKAQLQVDRDDLEGKKAQLEAQKTNLDAMLAQRQQESADFENEIKKLRQEAAVTKTQLQQEQNQLKKLQDEQRRQQQAAANANKGSGNGANAGSAGSGGGSAPAVPSGGGSGTGQEIADYACQYIGYPYVAGGTSLTEGADCSGFTYRVFMDFGYSLPRTSYSQRSAGTGVSYDEAQPGDLICYDGHVAIYIGGGKIVHASTERTGIKISNANYRPILTVRRIV